MFKKIFLLGVGYVAGNVISSMYGNKKKTVKNVRSKEDVKVLAENFLETQKKFMHELEKKYLTEENKEKFDEKKKEFKVLAKKYISQGEELLKQIEAKEKLEEGKTKLAQFFDSLFSKKQAPESENVPEQEDVSKK